MRIDVQSFGDFFEWQELSVDEILHLDDLVKLGIVNRLGSMKHHLHLPRCVEDILNLCLVFK